MAGGTDSTQSLYCIDWVICRGCVREIMAIACDERAHGDLAIPQLNFGGQMRVQALPLGRFAVSAIKQAWPKFADRTRIGARASRFLNIAAPRTKSGGSFPSALSPSMLCGRVRLWIAVGVTLIDSRAKGVAGNSF